MVCDSIGDDMEVSDDRQIVTRCPRVGPYENRNRRHAHHILHQGYTAPTVRCWSPQRAVPLQDDETTIAVYGQGYEHTCRGSLECGGAQRATVRSRVVRVSVLGSPAPPSVRAARGTSPLPRNFANTNRSRASTGELPPHHRRTARVAVVDNRIQRRFGYTPQYQSSPQLPRGR